MSVVILGGNECMERRYKELCQSYKCSAKVFTKPSGGLKNKLGPPASSAAIPAPCPLCGAFWKSTPCKGVAACPKN